MFESYFPEVVQVIAGDGRDIIIYFSDGKIGKYSMDALITKDGVFSLLESDDFFRNRLTVMNHTVAWDVSGNFDCKTCLDIDPFDLYENCEVISDPLAQAS